MKRKHKLVWRYAGVGVIAVAACVYAAVAVLDRETVVPDEGLVPGISDELAHGRPSNAPELRFTLVPLDFRHFPGVRTHRLPEDMGSGVAMEDLDGDGEKDLFLVNAGPLGSEQPPCAVFRNLGGFRFERVKTELPALLGMGVAAADYDGDADFDLFVTGYGRSVLLRNDGGFRFVDVTAEAGLEEGGFGAGACWGDFDGDGDLDLYVTRYVAFDEAMPVETSRRGARSLPVTLNPSAFPAQANLLYVNDGEGRFREAAGERGVSNPGGKSLGAVFADFDADGHLDLYVANDVSDNALYHGPRFEDITHVSCTADWRGAMGMAVGDPDGDADLDLFITHWITEENTLYAKEEGALRFSDHSVKTYLGPPGRGLVGWACDFADFDNDGRLDVYVVNGSTFEVPEARAHLVPMPVQLFWNGGRRFFDLAREAGTAFQAPIVGRGATSGDLDGDGDVDLLILVHGGAPLLLRNDTVAAGNHLRVIVRGSAPNLFAYGATVTVEAGGLKQVQQLGTKVSYLSSGPHELHFGLGTAKRADRVTVRFLTGTVVEKRLLRAGSLVVIKEVDPRTLGSLMDRARDADRDEAVEIYREVLRLDPAHPGALYNLAQLSKPDEAMQLCRRLLAVEPLAPRGHLLRARILSDPSRPERMDLDAALGEIARARKRNRDETGGLFEEGRILLLKGDPAAAATLLQKVKQNPRAAALAALCHYRADNPEAARRLLRLHAGARHPREGTRDQGGLSGEREKRSAAEVAGEGDTARKRMGQRDVLARLLEFGHDKRWRMTRLPLEKLDGAYCELGDVNGDGFLDARIGAWVVILDRSRAVETRSGAGARPVPRAQFPGRRYRFEEAAAWALDPPPRCTAPPPGTTATCEADADGDGDLDLFVACGGDDPAAPLPWWLLVKEKDGYRPVRGGLPEPGFCVAALAAADLDGDGRAEVLLKGGGSLPGDKGHTWIASLLR